jgi:hypothetical protein
MENLKKYRNKSRFDIGCSELGNKRKQATLIYLKNSNNQTVEDINIITYKRKVIT